MHLGKKIFLDYTCLSLDSDDMYNFLIIPVLN